MGEIDEYNRFYEIAAAMMVYARGLADGFASENPADRAAALDEFVEHIKYDASGWDGMTWFLLAALVLMQRYIPAQAHEFGQLAQAALDAWSNDGT